jgi:hypothetical protein
VGKVRRKWSKIYTIRKVISQRPPGGKVLPNGARVNLVVSKGKCHDDHDHDLDDRCPPFTEKKGP